MSLRYSSRPGRHERLLRYRQGNPFLAGRNTLSPDQLAAAQRLDHEEILAFIPKFRELIREAANLQPSEGSETILELKQKLERCYEQACGLADDQTEAKSAIRKLLQVIMAAIRSGARNDPLALAELEQEELARETHFNLLEQPLVCDLLSPDHSIPAEQLAAVLLTVEPAALSAALALFDAQQLQLLCGEAEQLLAQTPHAPAEDNLARMNQSLARLLGRAD